MKNMSSINSQTQGYCFDSIKDQTCADNRRKFYTRKQLLFHQFSRTQPITKTINEIMEQSPKMQAQKTNTNKVIQQQKITQLSQVIYSNIQNRKDVIVDDSLLKSLTGSLNSNDLNTTRPQTAKTQSKFSKQKDQPYLQRPLSAAGPNACFPHGRGIMSLISVSKK